MEALVSLLKHGTELYGQILNVLKLLGQHRAESVACHTRTIFSGLIPLLGEYLNDQLLEIFVIYVQIVDTNGLVSRKFGNYVFFLNF